MTTYRNGLTYGGGILETILDNFTCAKYKGEHHFPYYNYLGDHTDLTQRLDSNYVPKSGEAPINQLDNTLQHDIAYDKIKKEYLKDGNKEKALKAVHNADDQFVRKNKCRNYKSKRVSRNIFFISSGTKKTRAL